MHGAPGELEPASAESPDLLGPAFAGWLALPRSRHALALALLCLLGLARFWTSLCAPEPHIDEALYERAFQAVQAGHSPYTVPGYYYPTAFAFLGSWLDAQIGERAVRLGLRACNLLGLLGTLWLSAAWWFRSASARPLGEPWIERLAVAALLLVAAPGIAEGLHLGNLSFLAAGLALAGWTLAGRLPWLAGIALAASLALKPLTAAALPLLVLTPPEHRAKSYRIAGLVGGTLTTIIWLAFPYFGELLGQKVERIGRIRTWSVYRLADVLGLEIGRLVLYVGLVALALLICWRFRGIRASGSVWLAFVTATCVLTTPLIWGHTLILFFPTLVMATRVVSARWRAGKRSEPTWAEPTFVPLGCVTLLFFNPGAIDRLPVEALLLLVPISAVTLLTTYVCRYGRSARTLRG